MAEDKPKISNKETSVVNNRRKIMLGAIVAAIVAVMTTGIASTQNSIAQIEGENPSQGYDIHVTVNRHDSMNLNTPMDHYCKLDKRIVAVCLLYAKENARMKDAGPQPIASGIYYHKGSIHQITRKRKTELAQPRGRVNA